jgi:hypothetical protein
MLDHCTSARMAVMLLKTKIEFNVILHVIYIRRYYPASSLGSLDKEVTIMILTLHSEVSDHSPDPPGPTRQAHHPT